MSLLGILLSPSCLLGILGIHNLAELGTALQIELLNLGEYLKRILWIATQILDGVDVSVATKRSTVGLAVALVGSAVSLEGTLAHDALTDDEGRLALGCLGNIEGTTDLLNVVAVDLENLPTPSTILGSSIL